MKLSIPIDDPEWEAPDFEPTAYPPPPGLREWPAVKDWTDAHWTHWMQTGGYTPDQITTYLTRDRYRYGLGFQRHPSEPYTYFYLPTPAAVPFHASTAPNVVYGGAVGGAKSHSTRYDAYRHLTSIPEFKSIMMRRTLVELRDNHLTPCRTECETLNAFFGDEVMDLVPSTHPPTLTVRPTKGLMIFGHCQNEGDEEKYLGQQYDEFRPDEMATFTQKQIVGVAGRLRSTKRVGLHGRIVSRLIGTTNPGGAQAAWIVNEYVDKTITLDQDPYYDPADYLFIRSRLFDNPYLMDPDGTYTTYLKRLSKYSPQRRRQLLEGDWNAVTGQFFPEFRKDVHVAAIDIPQGCKIERWIDWGYDPHPGVCLWVACFPNGRLYVFAEWVFNGEGRPKFVAAKVAEKIAAITEDTILPEVRGTLTKTVADPSMFAKSGHTGESYAETFARHRVRLLPADNDRVMGWGRLRHWFGRHPEGGAYLMFSPDCPYAIRTIPALIHDDANPDDCDTHGEDHAADAIRYGVMSRPTPTRRIISPTPMLPEWVQRLVASDRAGAARSAGLVH